MIPRRAQVIGCGAYLPERVLTNADLSEMVETSDAWIVNRTGIRQRHIAAEGELTSDLAVHAARAALADAGIAAAEIDLIVLATSTPDETFPATATVVQHRLGMTAGAAFDVQAVCTGFIYALAVADNFIKVGQADTVLVIGAETYSRILDWTDRSTCVLFGDGAGALVLKAGARVNGVSDRGVLSTHLYSDGRYHDHLYVDGGPSSTGTVGHVRMAGREVFKHAVDKMVDAIETTLRANGLESGAIDLFVPHQANKRIITMTAKRLGLTPEQVVLTIDRHANTSSASIPLAIQAAREEQRILPGDLLLLEAMGGGFTWGAGLLRW